MTEQQVEGLQENPPSIFDNPQVAQAQKNAADVLWTNLPFDVQQRLLAAEFETADYGQDGLLELSEIFESILGSDKMFDFYEARKGDLR